MTPFAMALTFVEEPYLQYAACHKFLLGAGALWALGQEIVQDISWLPNLTG
jgi:hypothetical protein